MPTLDKVHLRNNNTAFFRSLFSALIALAISAVVLIVFFSLYHTTALFEQHNPNKPTPSKLSFNHENFKLVFGQGNKTPHALILTSLDERSGRAIVSKGNTSFDAANYPFLSYNVSNFHPGVELFLFWRTNQNIKQLHTAELYWSGDGTTYTHLGKEKNWKGTITEIGLLILGDLRNTPLEIGGIELSPHSTTTLLSTVWSEWLAFEGWSQKSINFLRGASPSPLLSPTTAIAVWCGLALLINISWAWVTTAKNNFSFKLNIMAISSILLIGWIALDLKWQLEISRQLLDTAHLYAAKSPKEKYLTAEDSPLYAYIDYLKKNILPKRTDRIFVLHNSAGHNYWRLRAQYHLLPHNVYNYGHYPQPRYMKTGDWLLLLGNIDGLDYNPKLQRLEWDDNQFLYVTLMDKNPLGKIFLIRNNAYQSQNCTSQQPLLISGTPEAQNRHLDNSTDRPILLRNITFNSDSTGTFESTCITLLPSTAINHGTEFTVRAINLETQSPCTDSKHTKCTSNASQTSTDFK